MNDFNTRIVVDGNDGTGKSTLVNSLRQLGFRNVFDRGEMTKATDDPTIGPVEGTIYILMVCPWGVSFTRLIEAGRDMSDPYHEPKALAKYDRSFRELAPLFNAHVIESHHPSINLAEVLRILGVSIRVGMPTGRLNFEHPATDLLPNPEHRQLVVYAAKAPVSGLFIRSKTYPQMVALGDLDTAIVGSDVLEGNPWADQCEVIERFPQAGIRIVIAAMSHSVWKKPLLRVATPYPEWAAKFFGEMGQPCTIFQVAGGSEALVVEGIADVCFDIVQTGRTLFANGLLILQEIGELDVCLIRHK